MPPSAGKRLLRKRSQRYVMPISHYDLSPVDIDLEGIGHILRDRRLEVPPYQRGYSWEAEEVGDFWWDLRAAFGSSTPQYFLGTIVLTREGSTGRNMIIDGQQRLTTTSLLFLALRNEFLRRQDQSRAEVIERDYGLALDLRTGRDVTRLLLNEDDQPHYIAAVNARPSATEASNGFEFKDSRIADALLFFEKQVREEAKNAGPHWAETLFSWVEFLEHRARVITVTVANESDAFLIFETLNARGRPLTVADLLKNYLFGLAGSDLGILRENWLSALRALETSADEEAFTTYVRHLWASTQGATRERELYAHMKASITSRPAALMFGQALESGAPLYSALISTEQPFWNTRRQLQPLAETLLRLRLEQNRPLLLAAMRKFDDAELATLIKAVVSWSVRGLIVGGIGGGTTERAYGEAAVAVSEGRARDTSDVFTELLSVIPTDESFRQSFAFRRISRTTIAKYIMIALSQKEEDASDPLIVPDSVESTYSLGTILPRKADLDEWPNFSADEVSQWVYRLGNQFVEDLEMQTGEVTPAFIKVRGVDWSPDAVASRQRAMADLAVSVWPRKP